MSEKPQQDVSRETQRDDPALTLEQIMLNEIMDRSMAKYSEPSEGTGAQQSTVEAEDVPRETQQDETRSDGESPLEKSSSPPEKNKPSSVYIYLAVLFGAAFLMLLLAYFVQQRNSDAVRDDLRMATASREELLENIKTLEEERDQLQKEVAYQKDRIAQKNLEASRAQTSEANSSRTLSRRSTQKQSLEYFWYLDQFMGNKEYTLASAVILFSADHYRSAWNSLIPVNPAQVDQYEAYRQELIDRGCLQQLDHFRDGGTDIWFADNWNPNQNEDAAALCILWCALNNHFVFENDQAAAQLLSLYPLGNPESGYQDRVDRLASKFTLQQFQLLKNDLTESKWLTIDENGTISEGPGPDDWAKNDSLYPLPFELPEGWNNGT